VVIHTSPDDLLTDQAPASAAAALEAAPRTNAIVRMRQNPLALSIETSICQQLTRRLTENVSRLNECDRPNLRAALTVR
jgi:hypothetical protein